MLRERFRDLVRRLRGTLGETSADSADPADRRAWSTSGSDAGGNDRWAPPSADDDVDLVPRPQRLLRLLEANDGRLRQQEIIRETGWSSSTVSRHLRRLEDEGRLSRVLVSGEYLVLLPTVDLDGSVDREGIGHGGIGRRASDHEGVERGDLGHGGFDHGNVNGGLDADGERSHD